MMSKAGSVSDSVPMDEPQYEQLYMQFYPRLYNYSFQFTKSEQLAQDLVHEVFLKLWENRLRVEQTAIGALLFKMTRNMCLNHLKHLKIVQNVQIDLAVIKRWEELYRIEFLKDEPVDLIEKELEQCMNDIMKVIPDKCREVFVLSRMDGLKNRQIADQLGVSQKTVEKHISQALRIFRNELTVRISA
jgi:RNA polymerase sigma-70 factor (ECF subfamily)